MASTPSAASAAAGPPPTGGSRKRQNDEQNAVDGDDEVTIGAIDAPNGAQAASKKTNYQPQTVSVSEMDGQSGITTIHVKLLIPSLAAGGIIGKGGETIAEMQKKTGVRFKMSKANEYYPGTTERVCLLTGSPDGIGEVIDFISDKIRERPDPHSRVAMDFDNKVCAERDKQLKIIIPNTTAGVVIGKGGNYIKRIKDESGAFVQISQKSKDTSLPERVVTIIGDKVKNREAMELIMDKIGEDPMSGSCLNINYSEVTGMVANFNPTGSPFATAPGAGGGSGGGGGNTSANSSFGSTDSQEQRQSNGNSSSNNNLSSSQLVLPLTSGGSLSMRFNIGPPRPPPDAGFLSQCLNVLRATFRAGGYSEAAIEEMAKSFHCLSTHGVLVFSQSNSSNSSSNNVPSQTLVSATTAPTTLMVDTSQPQQQPQQQQRHHLIDSPFTPAASASTTPTFINAAAAAATGGGSVFRGHEAFHTTHHDYTNGSAAAAAAAANGSPFAAFQSSQFQATSRYWSNSANGASDAQMTRGGGAGQDSSSLDPFGRQPPSPHHHGSVHHVQLQPQHLMPSSAAAAAAAAVAHAANGSQNANSFGLGPNTGLAAAVAAGNMSKSPVDSHLRGEEPTDKLELDINESIIGAIIGPNGRSISDIQQVSGARIQISKKGIYSPGTRNRIVTVSGTKSAISMARTMIDERIGEEESKRVHERHSYHASASVAAAGAASNGHHAPR